MARYYLGSANVIRVAMHLHCSKHYRRSGCVPPLQQYLKRPDPQQLENLLYPHSSRNISRQDSLKATANIIPSRAATSISVLPHTAYEPLLTNFFIQLSLSTDLLAANDVSYLTFRSKNNTFVLENLFGGLISEVCSLGHSSWSLTLSTGLNSLLCS